MILKKHYLILNKLHNPVKCVKLLVIMDLKNIKISPVNVEERKKLDIKSGDTVRVWQKIQEKGKTRLQAFEGLVLARKHGYEAGATFIVRKVTSGVGVEKIFPLYSPVIDKIEVIKRSKVRRAKLYYIRDKVAKEIRRQMRKVKALPDNNFEEEVEGEKVESEDVENNKKEENTLEEVKVEAEENFDDTPTETKEENK